MRTDAARISPVCILSVVAPVGGKTGKHITLLFKKTRSPPATMPGADAQTFHSTLRLLFRPGTVFLKPCTPPSSPPPSSPHFREGTCPFFPFLRSFFLLLPVAALSSRPESPLAPSPFPSLFFLSLSLPPSLTVLFYHPSVLAPL